MSDLWSQTIICPSPRRSPRPKTPSRWQKQLKPPNRLLAIKSKPKPSAVSKKKALLDHDDNAEGSALDVDGQNDVSHDDDFKTPVPRTLPAGSAKKKTT